ncbi:unnamed protein product, partial [Closterium sp. Naga37s-1]
HPTGDEMADEMTEPTEEQHRTSLLPAYESVYDQPTKQRRFFYKGSGGQPTKEQL